MKTLTIELEDDGTFYASVKNGPLQLATASGGDGVVTAHGQVHFFSTILGAMAAQKWIRTSPATESCWEPILGGFGIPGCGWGFMTPAGPFVGLESEAAAVSAAARLAQMHAALTHPPSGPYQVFMVPGEKWGVFDAAGTLHAGMGGRQDALGLADKMRGGGAC